MDLGDLSPRLLVQNGIETLKIITVYAHHVTAQLMVPRPHRTVIRHYFPRAIAQWRPVTHADYARYVTAYEVGVR
jgi:hypothetical protein